MSAAPALEEERGWSASLDLVFERRGDRSVLARRSHRGPLSVQRSFHPEGPGTAHVYVLHPPGGLVGGDRLNVTVTADPGAHAVLTTPAATKLYRSAGKLVRVETAIHVREGATIEWLPSETLAFEDSYGELSTRIELDPGGVFVGWDVLGLGRPAAAEGFARGELTQRFEIWRAGEPLLIERGRFEGGGPLLSERWGLGGAPVSGVLAAAPADETTLGLVRAAVMPASSVFGATLLGRVLLARVLSAGAAEARNCFEAAWQALRRQVVGLAACPPRVWKT